MAWPPLRRRDPCSRLCLMDWTAILRKAGIPESPGRDAAIERAAQRVAARRAAASKTTKTGQNR